VIAAYLDAFKQNKGFDFPIDDPAMQLRVAIDAVFDSWMNERAIEYRKMNNIDAAMGTAVNVQAMVFGNMGEDSGTGVLFTRNPSTGANEIMGEFLQDAQGEDVVAGIRTPVNLQDMKLVEIAADPEGAFEEGENLWATISDELIAISEQLEEMYLDMVDVEFTVQQGKLFILQSRAGKRSAAAAFRIAVEMVDAGTIEWPTARGRITGEQFKVMRRPRLDPAFKVEPNFKGLPACPGVVTGVPVFSADSAVNCTEPCIMVTHETTPDDLKGMAAALGILTQTGGATSHAAVVARAMDTCCVVGCTALDLTADWQDVTKITIDGSTGNVWLNVDVPVIDSTSDPYVERVMGWCLEDLGAREAAPVDMGNDARYHGIFAATWWGNPQWLTPCWQGSQSWPMGTRWSSTSPRRATSCSRSMPGCWAASGPPSMTPLPPRSPRFC
jgi:pyruvate,orthophosphate dikinase